MSGAPARPATVETERRLDQWRWWIGSMAGVWLALSTVTVSIVLTPGESLIALTLVVLGLVSVWMRPVAGVYLIVVFTLLGDARTAPWYPFGKNFSSVESILYVSDRIIVNPLEVFLVVTTASWLLRRVGNPEWTFRSGRLLLPLAVFSAFVGFGLVWGLGRGGNVNIGLWELRPLAYLPLFYVLVTNIVTSTAGYRRLMWVAVGAVTGQSLLALSWYYQLDPFFRAGMRGLTEHASSVHYNAVIVLALSVWLLPGCSRAARAALLVTAVPVVWVFFLAERRSAAVALAFAVVLFAIVLYRLNRRGFCWFVPVVAVASTVYLLAFWHVEGRVAFPARAIKSVIAPGQLSGADQSSNEYREIEAMNVHFTIRSDPLRGVGFGQAFYTRYPLPDISFFPFWQFMPHHSLFWIWLKTGFGGFVAMLFLFLRVIQHGVRSVADARPGNLQAISLTAVLYVVMYLVFAYVDIAWDIRSMIFMAVAMAICADLVPLARREDEATMADDGDEGDDGDGVQSNAEVGASA